MAQVGIGTTTPDPSSQLDITSTDSGLLVPRMTLGDRINISSPAEGLLVYQTDDVAGFYYWDGIVWNRVLDKGNDGVPVGAIFSFPMATAPTGYLVCDGSAISRSNYSNLFTIIGTMYGSGDGSTTFNLPDYRGQFLRGYDNGAGTDPDAGSRLDRGDGTTGDNVGTKQNNGLSSHWHIVDPPGTNTYDSGNHNHSLSAFSVTSGVGGSHNHSVSGISTNTSSISNHAHGVSYGTRTVGAGSPYTTIREVTGSFTVGTTSTGSHTHSVFVPAHYTNSVGNHTHTVTIPATTSLYSGNHSHSLNIPSFYSATTGGNETRPTNITVQWCIKY